MLSQLRKFLGLTWEMKWLLFESWMTLLAMDLRLRWQPFRHVRRLASAAQVESGPPEAGTGRGEEIERIAWCVAAAASYHIVGVRCLARSLALQRLLGRRGIPSRLRIGVDRRDGSLIAHAWVEHAGRPVADPEALEGRYMPLLDAG